MNISEDYGVDVNLSMVFNSSDGSVSAGLHVVDSDGFDISVEHDGDTVEEVCTYLIDAIEDGMNEFYMSAIKDDEEQGYEDVAQMIVDLEDEIKSLKIDNAILQQRIDAIVNKKETKENTRPMKNKKDFLITEDMRKAAEILSRFSDSVSLNLYK